jgi:hypothetical protein
MKKRDEAAYTAYPGLTREEAADKGYVEVENNADGTAPVYGRYNDAPAGYGAGVQVSGIGDTRVVPAGGLGAAPPYSGGDKGALLNVNDPVIHGVADNNPHPDGASPNDEDNEGLADALRDGSHAAGQDVTPAKKGW